MLLAQPIIDLYNWFVGVDDTAEKAAATTHDLAKAQEEVNRELERAIAKLEKLREEQKTAHDQRIRQLKLEGASIKEITDAEEQKAKDNLKNTQDQIKEQEKAIAKQRKIEQKAFKHHIATQKKDVGMWAKHQAMRRHHLAAKELQINKDKLKKLKSQEIDHQQDLTEVTQDGQAERLAKWKAYQAKKKQAEADRLSATRAIEDAEQNLKVKNREKDLEDLVKNKELETGERLRLEKQALEELEKIELENIRLANARKIEDIKNNEKLKKDEKLELERLALLELKQQEQEIEDKFNSIIDEKESAINQKNLEKEKALNQLAIELIKDKQAKEIMLLMQSYEEKFKLAEGNDNLELLLKEEQEAAIAEIEEKYREEKKAKDKEDLQERMDNFNVGLDNTKTGLQAIGEISNMVAEQQMAKAGDDEKKKEQIRKQAFNRNKAIQLSLAAIDGFKAITTSLAQSPVAIGPIPNPAGIASLAFAALTTGINIAKIAATKYKGSPQKPTTPSPSGITATASAPTPQFNVVGAGSENQLAQTLGAQQQEPVKAFVVAGDVTTAQSLERDKIELTGL